MKGHCCSETWLFACKVCRMASSSITRWITTSVLEKCLNLILLLKARTCVACYLVFYTDVVGQYLLFEVLHKEGASLALLQTDPGEGPVPLAELVSGDNALTRGCEFFCTHKFFPPTWHLLQMCVWKLFQMFQSLFSSLSLGSILISPCQCSIQNTCRHSLGSATVSFVQFYFFFFL